MRQPAERDLTHPAQIVGVATELARGNSAKLGSKSGSIRANQAEIADSHGQTPNARSTA